MDLVVRVARLPQPGQTVPGHGFQTIPGGKGANQAAAAARLGARVAMVGRVGNDAMGRRLVENLEEQGVDVGLVRTDEVAPTGTALIVVDEVGENSIVIAAGANGLLDAADLDAAEPLFAGAKLLLVQFEVPLATVAHAMAIARRHGVRVVLNPAPALAVDAGLLAGADYLVPNETEAGLLAGVEVRDLPSAEEAARKLQALGAPVVIVTLGADGALAVDGERALHVPAHPVPAVDTTAAGDAFVGGLAVALVRGWPLLDAVRYATCAGTLAVTRFGAQTSLPSAAEVQALFDQG
jgi:ribokinase